MGDDKSAWYHFDRDIAGLDSNQRSRSGRSVELKALLDKASRNEPEVLQIGRRHMLSLARGGTAEARMNHALSRDYGPSNNHGGIRQQLQRGQAIIRWPSFLVELTVDASSTGYPMSEELSLCRFSIVCKSFTSAVADSIRKSRAITC